MQTKLTRAKNINSFLSIEIFKLNDILKISRSDEVSFGSLRNV